MALHIIIILNNKSAYLDAKKSRFIQKEVYESYLELAKDNLVILSIKEPESNSEYTLPIKQLKLIFGSKYKLPVDEEGWICQKAYNDPSTPFYQPEKWKGHHGSGTPFREFDFEQMQSYRVHSEPHRLYLFKCIFSGYLPCNSYPMSH